MRKPLYPGVPDEHSLQTALEQGYAVTRWGLAWPGLRGWEQPDGQRFPYPALLIEINSKRPPLNLCY